MYPSPKLLSLVGNPGVKGVNGVWGIGMRTKFEGLFGPGEQSGVRCRGLGMPEFIYLDEPDEPRLRGRGGGRIGILWEKTSPTRPPRREKAARRRVSVLLRFVDEIEVVKAKNYHRPKASHRRGGNIYFCKPKC